MNLAFNARNAMPNGGEIYIRSEDVEISADEASSLKDSVVPGKYLSLSVLDTGTGIPAEIQSKIFEPFYTTKEVGQGSGLGLSAVYGTVLKHKGAMTFTSQPGKGSCFTVYLPVEMSEKKSEPANTSFKMPKNVKILIIDDEPVCCEILTEICQSLGHQTHFYINPLDALEHYKSNWADYDIVVIDMVMPDLGGVEVFQKLREINPGVQVLITSGFGEGAGVQKLLKEGGDHAAFIHKPFVFADLFEKIAVLMQNNT